MNTGDTKIEEATGVKFDVEDITGDSNQKVGTMILVNKLNQLLMNNLEKNLDSQLLDGVGQI